MGPLTCSELGSQFDIKRALSIDLLPEVYLNKKPQEALKLLKSYIATYLKEEIKAEALTRNLEGFARFLIESVHSVSQPASSLILQNLQKKRKFLVTRFLVTSKY